MWALVRCWQERAPEGNGVTKLALCLLAFLPLAMFLGPGLTDVCLTGIGLLFLCHVWQQCDVTWHQHSWLRVAALLWIYLMIRSIWTDYPHMALERAVLFGRYLLFTLACQHWLLAKPSYRHWLWSGMMVAVVFAGVDTMIQYVYGVDLLGHPWWMVNRLTGPLGRPRVGLTMAWLGVPVAAFGLHVLLQNRSWDWRAMGWVCLCLGVLGVGLISGDRGGFLEMVCAFGLVFLASPILRRWLWVPLLAIPVLLGVLMWQGSEVFDRQILSTVQKIAHFSDSDYGVVYRGGWLTFLDHPLLGTGLKQYRYVCPKGHDLTVKVYRSQPRHYKIDDFGCGHHPHNLYLEWLAESGLVGFGLFFWIIGLWCRQFWQYGTLLSKDPFLLGCLAVFLARLMPLLPSGSFHVVWSAVPLWLMAGVLLGAVQHSAKPLGEHSQYKLYE